MDLAQSNTWGCSCRKPDGSQTQKSESVSAHSLQMHSGPLYSQPGSTRRLGILPLLLAEQLFLSGAREGACTPSTTCDLPQAFGREIILQFGKPHQMHKRPVGATAKSRAVREHQPPPALWQGCLPHAEKNLCPFFWVRRSICRTETNQSQL